MDRLNSPFIVKGHYEFETDEKYYIIMDYMCGGRLFYHLKRVKKFTVDHDIFGCLNKPWNFTVHPDIFSVY